ncbi:MAG: hypothetical protein ACYS8K_11495 [Planctomycetota bacterium]|jgi:hypothetical protein
MAAFFEEMVRRREQERLEDRRRALAERDAPRRRAFGGATLGGARGGARYGGMGMGMMPRVNPNVLGMSRDPNAGLRRGVEREALLTEAQRQNLMRSRSGEQFSPEQAAMADVRGQREMDWTQRIAADRDRARTFGAGAAPGMGSMALSPEQQQALLAYVQRHAQGG